MFPSPEGKYEKVEKIVARMCSSQANERTAGSSPPTLSDFNVQRLYVKHSLRRGAGAREFQTGQNELQMGAGGQDSFMKEKHTRGLETINNGAPIRPGEVNCPLCAVALLQRDAQRRFCSAARCLCYSAALMHTDQ